MTEPYVRLAALAAIILWVSGCGLKGDLYIPEKEPAQSEPLAAPESADPGEDQNDDETTGN